MLPIYKRIIALPKSPFRRKQINDKKFGYSKESVDKIVSYTFERIDSVDKIDKFEMVTRASKNSKSQILIQTPNRVRCANYNKQIIVSIERT